MGLYRGAKPCSELFDLRACPKAIEVSVYTVGLGSQGFTTAFLRKEGRMSILLRVGGLGWGFMD